MKEKQRFGLWILLMALTVLIFLFPARLTLESHPVESVYVFDNLPLFGALYFAWFAVLLALALSRGRGRTNELEKIALVPIFTLVFAGLWVSLRQSYAGEAAWHASNIAYLNQNGQIPLTGHLYLADFPGVLYLADFPGIAILGSAISQVTGLADFDVLTVLLMLQILLFPILLYLTFKNVIKDSRWAALSVLLAINGSIMIAKLLFQFHPGAFAPLLLLPTFLLVLTHSSFRTWQGVLLCSLLMLAVTITHFVTTAVFLLILLGIYILQKLSNRNLVTLSSVTLCGVIIVSWQMYLATNTFEGLVNLVSRMLEDLRQGLLISGYTAALADAYTREGIPLWANLTRYLWLALFVFAAIVGFKNLLKARSLDDIETKVTGGLVGVGFMFIAVALAAGMTELFRVLIYAPFFTAPILVMFCYKLRQPLKRYSFITLTALLLVFSFPTFLAHNNTVGTTAYYSYEFSGYERLKSWYGDIKGVYIGGGVHPAPLLDYYIKRPYYTGTSFYFLEEHTPSGFLKELHRQLTLAQNRGKQATSLFVVEEGRLRAQFEHFLGIDLVTRPEWDAFKDRLSHEDLIYSSGYIQFYKV
ncbi:hypothetical protein M1O18_03100 [Dehalococcoidia bacterium]|nr:hypothetical protein [Dehalococcoidia bacterium]